MRLLIEFRATNCTPSCQLVLFYLISPIAMTTGFSFSCSIGSHDLQGKKCAREQVMIFRCCWCGANGLAEKLNCTNEGQINACRIYERLSPALLWTRSGILCIRGCILYMYTDYGGQSVRNKKDIKWSHVQLLSSHRFSTDISSVYVSAREKRRSTRGQLMRDRPAHKRSQRAGAEPKMCVCSIS